MYGVVTRNPDELEWSEFDLGFYEVKDVTGRSAEPVPGAVNMVSCFGDNAAAAAERDAAAAAERDAAAAAERDAAADADADESLVAVSDEGEPATRERPYFDWAYICPTQAQYREGLLEIIDDCADANPDVRLDDVGFARAEYCHCERCDREFAESEYDDRMEWRASVITEFVAEAVEHVPGKVYLTLYPDPYPGHLYERTGIDLEALSEHVDEFVIPLYDMGYTTTYWLEIIAQGFRDALDTPFSIELYAVDLDIDNLIHATEVADAYAEDVFFGYDASNAQAALRRMKAESREGVSHGN